MWTTPLLFFETKENWQASDFFNYQDLNRIESNLVEVENTLRSIHYRIPTLISRYDRDITSVDYISSINRIEYNLDTIQTNFVTPIGWREKKDWEVGDGFSFDDVNRIESNILKLKDLSHLAAKNFKYCGTMTCGGEEVIY